MMSLLRAALVLSLIAIHTVLHAAPLLLLALFKALLPFAGVRRALGRALSAIAEAESPPTPGCRHQTGTRFPRSGDEGLCRRHLLVAGQPPERVDILCCRRCSTAGFR